MNNGMKRAYSMDQWQRDFASAFAAAVPMESVPTQARGPLLAADNDEPEPRVRCAIKRESTGYGLSDSTTLVCACGWRGRAVFQYEDRMSTELQAQERAHLAGGA